MEGPKWDLEDEPYMCTAIAAYTSLLRVVRHMECWYGVLNILNCLYHQFLSMPSSHSSAQGQVYGYGRNKFSCSFSTSQNIYSRDI